MEKYSVVVCQKGSNRLKTACKMLPIPLDPSPIKNSKLENIWISDTNLTKKEKSNIIKSLPKNYIIYWTSDYNQMLDINENCYCER